MSTTARSSRTCLRRWSRSNAPAPVDPADAPTSSTPTRRTTPDAAASTSDGAASCAASPARASSPAPSSVGIAGSSSACATRRHIPVRGCETLSFGLSQQPEEAGGSLAWEVPGRVGAAPTTTEQVGTARRPGSGKRDGEVYERRNQWWNPLKRPAGSKPGGSGPVSSACPPAQAGRVTRWRAYVPSARRPRRRAAG